MIKKFAWFGVLLIGFVAHADLFTALEDAVGTVVRNGVELVTGCAHLSANLKRCGAPTVDGSKYCEAHKCKLCNGEVWAGRFCRDCEMSGKSVSREKDQIVEPRVRYSSEPKRLVSDSTPSVESAFVPQTKQAPKRQDGFGVRVSQKKQDSEMLQMFERHREKVRTEIKKGDFSIAYAIIADGVRQEYQKYQSDDNLKKWSDLEHEVRIAQAMAACRPFVVSIRESIASNDFETARQHLAKGRGVAPFLWCTERLSWEKLEREIIVAHKSKQRKDAMGSFVTDVRNAVATNGFAEARSRISEGRMMYPEYSTADNSKDEAWDKLEAEVDEKEVDAVLKPMIKAVRDLITARDFNRANELLAEAVREHPNCSMKTNIGVLGWKDLEQEINLARQKVVSEQLVKSVRDAIVQKDFDKANELIAKGRSDHPNLSVDEVGGVVTWNSLKRETDVAIENERVSKSRKEVEEPRLDGVEYSYSISDGAAAIRGRGLFEAAIPTSTSGALVIPSTLGGCPVKTIFMSAFAYCSSITSITIPPSVTTIDDSAFFYCSSLASVTIPEGVTKIGAYTFSHCESLSSVTIPDGVTTIGLQAFSSCSSLTSIRIPKSVTTIETEAFANCWKLQHIYVEQGDVVRIRRLLEERRAMGDAVVPMITELNHAPEQIGAETWQWRRVSGAKETVNGIVYIYSIENGKAKIGSKDGLSAAIPTSTSGALEIPSVLGGCPVTAIGEGAFAFCAFLTSITIPEGVSEIDFAAFSCCSSVTSIIIPKSVRTIGTYAFRNCKSLTSITIPAGVTTISSSAFSECSSLVSVVISDCATTIESRAFADCSSLESITIPKGMITIGDFAFSRCSSLMSLTIPTSVETIREGAFRECKKLKDIYVERGGTAHIREVLEEDRALSPTRLNKLTFHEF